MKGVVMENEKFVTYKWLIGTMLSTLGICLVFIGIISQFSSKAIDLKLNKELYDRDYGSLCSSISDIQKTVDSNQKLLEKFNQNQVLVLRHLRIEPVK